MKEEVIPMRVKHVTGKELNMLIDANSITLVQESEKYTLNTEVHQITTIWLDGEELDIDEPFMNFYSRLCELIPAWKVERIR